VNPRKIDDCVEALCRKGCREVSRIILALERNEPVAETLALSSGERAAVLAELKSIMAVYDARCGA
jgi:hypothetical protein